MSDKFSIPQLKEGNFYHLKFKNGFETIDHIISVGLDAVDDATYNTECVWQKNCDKIGLPAEQWGPGCTECMQITISDENLTELPEILSNEEVIFFSL